MLAGCGSSELVSVTLPSGRKACAAVGRDLGNARGLTLPDDRKIAKAQERLIALGCNTREDFK